MKDAAGWCGRQKPARRRATSAASTSHISSAWLAPAFRRPAPAAPTPRHNQTWQDGSTAVQLQRLGLRTGLTLEAGAWHISMLLITDVSILLSALLFAVRGLEIYLRAPPDHGAVHSQGVRLGSV